MPAPAVYVIAIVGTVGVAIAFKEFIYPHIAPRIDRWKVEFQAARRRRADAERMAEIALIQRGPGKDGHQNPEDNDTDSDHSDVDFGKGNATLRSPVRPFMKNGLLIRRRTGQSQTTPTKPGCVELEDWTTGSSTSTEMSSQRSVLRSRKGNRSLDKLIQPIHQHAPFSLTASASPTSTSGGEDSMQTKTGHKQVEPELKKTRDSHAFLDEAIQAIPYTPLSPIRTPTPTYVLYNSSLMHSPLDSPFSSKVSPSPEGASLLFETNSSTSHPLLTQLQPTLSSPCVVNASANKAEPFSRSPSPLENIVSQTSNTDVPSVPPFLPLNVSSTTTANNSTASFLLPLSSPPVPVPSSPPSQLLSPVGLHPSPYQTPPHVHAIPSLSQSYPLDDLLDYEHGLELLSPPSPLSRADSPYEFAGLSPRLEIGERSTLLFASSGDTGEQEDSITNLTNSATYLSFFSSPALSASSVFPNSENGYENDSTQSEISSALSSPLVVETRLGDTEPEILLHDQARPNHSVSPLSSGSSLTFDVNYPYPQRHRRQQHGRNTSSTSTRPSVSASPTLTTTRSQESDIRRPIVTFNDNEYDDVDTQTLSPRNRARSPWTMMNGMRTESTTTTSISTEIQPAARLSRGATSESDFDTGSEQSDLDFLSIPAKNYTSADGRGGVDGRAGGIRGQRRGDGNESDASSWSLAGSSE